MRLSLLEIQRMTQWMREHGYRMVDVDPCSPTTVYYYRDDAGYHDGRYVWRTTKDQLQMLENMMLQNGYVEVELDSTNSHGLFFRPEKRMLNECGQYLRR